MIKLKQLLVEGIKEKAAEDFIRQTIKGTEWYGKIYAAGGYVRDELSGKNPKDLDLLVDAPNGGIEFANWITKKMGNYKEGSNPVVFPRFSTAKFTLDGIKHNDIDLSGFDIESVMPRSEKYTAGSRKPDVSQSTLQGDAERRDLTFNALFKNISTGEILDLTGKGKEDLEKGVIRTPLDPDVTFQDDPLRMLRVVRFYAKMGYKLPMYIIKALKKNAHHLQNISSERIQEELNKMLVTTSPEKAIRLLQITGLSQFIFPELDKMIGLTQNKYHSQDAMKHTLTVLKNTKPNLYQRLMALFHDVGKVTARSVTPTGVHFYGHEFQSGPIVKEIMTRLRYPVDLINAVVLGVTSHMKLKHGGDDAVKLSDKTLRKFKIEMGDKLEDILDVIHADNISHASESSMPNQVENVKKRLEKLNVTVKKPTLPINGNDLIQLGIKPGPIFAKIMDKITEKWYENPEISKDQALKLAKSIAGNQKQ